MRYELKCSKWLNKEFGGEKYEASIWVWFDKNRAFHHWKIKLNFSNLLVFLHYAVGLKSWSTIFLIAWIYLRGHLREVYQGLEKK